jgi:hypothetical protein
MIIKVSILIITINRILEILEIDLLALILIYYKNYIYYNKSIVKVIYIYKHILKYNLGSGVAPPGFSGHPIGQGACTVAVLLFSTTINTALPPSALPSSSCVLFQLSVARSRFLARPNSCAARSLPPGVPRPSLAFRPRRS